VIVLYGGASRLTPHRTRQGYVPLNTVPQLSRLFYNLLKNFTCKGKPVSAYYNCIDDGMLCSGVGMCSNNSCVCPAGKCGAYCGEACSGRRKDNVPVILGKCPGPVRVRSARGPRAVWMITLTGALGHLQARSFPHRSSSWPSLRL
jgi:hypothetical protein